jgi:PPOX class probable F420-dependent enzyme
MADAPIRLDETTRAAVASGRLVHLATINPDGTPQVTCIYVGWDGDEIVAGHLADHVKLRNIRRDPRVTLSVESDVEVEGFSPYVVIQGIARVEEGGAVPLFGGSPTASSRHPETTGPKGSSPGSRRGSSRAPAPGVLPTETVRGSSGVAPARRFFLPVI